MFDENAIDYKSMYHTMLIAADKAIDLLNAKAAPEEAIRILLQAMEESEEIYIGGFPPKRNAPIKSAASV